MQLFKRIYHSQRAKSGSLRTLVFGRKTVCFCATVFVGLMVALLFIFNRKVMYYVDDYTYMYIYSTLQPVENLGDVLQSQINHYYTWGGRSVVHFLLQAVLLLPPLVVDIINTLFFFVLAGVIYLHVKGRGRQSASLFAGIVLSLWLFIPSFGETCLWLTGSCNYMWGTALILLFLLPYRFYSGKKPRSATAGYAFALLAFAGGVVAGWIMENGSAALIVMIGVFIFQYIKKKWDKPLWVFAGLAGTVAGFCIMLLAPGNMVRAAEGNVHLSLFMVCYNIFKASKNLFPMIGLPLLLAGIIYMVHVKLSPGKYRDTGSRLLPYIAGMLAGIYSMAFSPVFFTRSWFVVICICTVCLGIVYHRLNTSDCWQRCFKYFLLVFALCAFLASLFDAVKDIQEAQRYRYGQLARIEEAKRSGAARVELERNAPRTKFAVIDSYYAEPAMSDYFGIEIVYPYNPKRAK